MRFLDVAILVAPPPAQAGSICIVSASRPCTQAILAAALVACGARTELSSPEPPCPGASADCDHDPANGCEVDLGSDVNHCGACGVVCSGGLSCAGGVCVPGDTLVQIEAMISTQFVRTADGRVFVWGSNQYGKADPKSDAPFILMPQELDLPEPAREVHGSTLFACARGASGRVWCWGSSAHIPGAGPDESNHDFMAVPGVSDARALVASNEGQCVFDGLRRGLCWSANEMSELSVGSGQEVPRPLPGTVVCPLSSAVEMSAVEVEGNLVTLFPSLAAVDGGPVFTWGDPRMLGWGSPGMSSPALIPSPVPGLADPVRVDSGKQSRCASLRDGRVYCWGSEIFADTAWEPFLAFEHGPYVKVGVAGHLCALRPTGHVECNDPWDQEVDRDGVADISSGVHSLCLLMQDQRVLCKGDNSEAQQGNGSIGGSVLELTEVPIPVHH